MSPYNLTPKRQVRFLEPYRSSGESTLRIVQGAGVPLLVNRRETHWFSTGAKQWPGCPKEENHTQTHKNMTVTKEAYRAVLLRFENGLGQQHK